MTIVTDTEVNSVYELTPHIIYSNALLFLEWVENFKLGDEVMEYLDLKYVDPMYGDDMEELEDLLGDHGDTVLAEIGVPADVIVDWKRLRRERGGGTNEHYRNHRTSRRSLKEAIKPKLTRNDVKEADPILVKYGSPASNYLERGYSPVGYTCGQYGWNSDVYCLNGKYFETGYRCVTPGYDGISEVDDLLAAAGISSANGRVSENYRGHYANRHANESLGRRYHRPLYRR